jgi:deoxyribodipyrimidine photo-lyase
LAKQTQQYDPHGEYIAKWQGNEHCDAQLDDLDAADWPV